MPFTRYKSSFDPETLQILQQAFDMAWDEVEASLSETDILSVRDVIAKRIVTAAREHGERDPNRLKALALEGLAR